MGRPLWAWEELLAASGGTADGAPHREITGFSLDTRSLQPGEVFVALKDARDGHDFVTAAFKAGAAAAIVAAGYARNDGDGALIRVDEPLRALERIGMAARARLAPEARVLAVTGSVGKTGTKEMLRACCARLGPTHAADKSFNNHWGVPLTLARMPAGTRFAVFEIGMNHAGEITPLTRMVRPHVAIITTVESVHLEHFGSVEAIADAKAEIFRGLEAFAGPDIRPSSPSGSVADAWGGNTAVLNRDNPHFERLASAAALCGARIIGFGRDPSCDVRATAMDLSSDGTRVEATIAGRTITYRIAAPGAHIAQNSLAVVAALGAAGADLDAALPVLALLAAPQGRGARTVLQVPGGKALLIDESYNANPASMRAALAAVATVPRSDYPRRIAVIGDMLELGAEADALHIALKDAVDGAGTDLVLGCGPSTRGLIEALDSTRRGRWAPTSDGIRDALLAAVRAGDVVMIKGSNGSRLGPLVTALKERFASTST